MVKIPRPCGVSAYIANHVRKRALQLRGHHHEMPGPLMDLLYALLCILHCPSLHFAFDFILVAVSAHGSELRSVGGRSRPRQ